MQDFHEVLQEAKSGDRIALARLITNMENVIMSRKEIELQPLQELEEELESVEDKVYIIGFAGPPGAGKSTLISAIIPELCKRFNKLAVLGVDPSSVLTGGSILGDRLRMMEALKKCKTFMRSFSSGSSLGGLSPSVFYAVKLLNYCNYECVLLEGVGAGQLDVKPLLSAHTRVVVLTPASGDYLQVVKAGLMELGDIYVINKSDLAGADVIESYLKEYVRFLGKEHYGWSFPVIRTIAEKGEGIKELVQAIESHREYLTRTGEFLRRTKDRKALELREHISMKLEELVNSLFLTLDKDSYLKQLVESYLQGGCRISPSRVVTAMLKRVSKIIGEEVVENGGTS